ncbi:MAG: M3 family oligoendopeptidase [Alphaproteobacteria bacterium]
MTPTPTPTTPPPGELPAWVLDDLYPGGESAELAADLAEAERAAEAFATRYRGRLGELDGASFGRAIVEFERISELLSRVMSYAGLLYSINQVDPGVGRFFQAMQERVTVISSLPLFFTLEINKMDDDTFAAKLTAPETVRYKPWLQDLRAFRDHQLSEEVERVLNERSVVGTAAWVRLFDETLAALRFEVDGHSLTLTEALDLLSDPEPGTRRTAGKAVGKVLGENLRLFSRITNTLVKEKEIDDQWRKYPHPVSSRNLANQVEDEVVEALVAAVRGAYGDLAHRYYAMKARWLGLERLEYWDRNAPLPDDDDRRYTWTEARDTVLAAYDRFSPELGAIGRTFFERPWIDAGVRPGKSSGAFAHPTVPAVHPYLMLNFMGRSRDVMTLAHELGHGVHQVLAAPQGLLLSSTPLTLAETASVFGEMLTFRALLDAETDPRRRRVLLASKVEDMLNTVVRQVAFHSFEQAVHAGRREGELSDGQLGDIWMAVQSESLGPAFHFDEEYRHYWAYISHFVHAPFYVYAYAFGDCLVNSLYAVFEGGAPGFQDKYLTLLRAGGTLRHGELLAPFGLDASDPAFWSRGLGVIGGFIDQLERLG